MPEQVHVCNRTLISHALSRAIIRDDRRQSVCLSGSQTSVVVTLYYQNRCRQHTHVYAPCTLYLCRLYLVLCDATFGDVYHTSASDLFYFLSCCCQSTMKLNVNYVYFCSFTHQRVNQTIPIAVNGGEPFVFYLILISSEICNL